MIQDVINGIVSVIKNEYGSDYRIYTESVEQGLREPCFSVLCLNPSSSHLIAERHQRRYPFIIRYFPLKNEEPFDECLNVCERLYDILQNIIVNGAIIHSLDMSGNIVDGVLQFEVTYSHFAVQEQNSGESMDDIEVNTNV